MPSVIGKQLVVSQENAPGRITVLIVEATPRVLTRSKLAPTAGSRALTVRRGTACGWSTCSRLVDLPSTRGPPRTADDVANLAGERGGGVPLPSGRPGPLRLKDVC